MTVRTNRPNFFLVGAPKCGTTSMDQYLRQHPGVFIPERKEIHYFGSDLTYTCVRPDLNDYLKYFRGVSDETAIGESSVFYMLSNRAAAEIADFAPEARIIAMLRNPVDVMYAMHSENLFNGNEDVEDFEEALALEDERRQGRHLPDYYFNLESLFYRDVVKFAAQLERYLERFPRERIHVILFPDLKEDTPGTYRETCRFLEVDDGFAPDFQRANPNSRVRSKLVQNLIYRTNWASSYKVQRLIPGALRAWLRRLNRVDVARQPLEPATRARLREECRPEVERLEGLLKRDLSMWKEKAGQSTFDTGAKQTFQVTADRRP